METYVISIFSSYIAGWLSVVALLAVIVSNYLTTKEGTHTFDLLKAVVDGQGTVATTNHAPRKLRYFLVKNRSHDTVHFNGETSEGVTQYKVEHGARLYIKSFTLTTLDQTAIKEDTRPITLEGVVMTVSNILSFDDGSVASRVVKIVIETDTHWKVRVVCDVPDCEINAISSDSVHFKEVGNYTNNVSHLLTPDNSRIDFKDAVKGYSEDELYYYCKTRVAFNKVEIKVTKCK